MSSKGYRRIRRPADKEKIFEELVNGENKIFGTFKDLFMFAACLGFANNKKQPFKKTLPEIPWSVFSSDDKNEAVFNLFALSETNDITILGHKQFDEKAKIVEEYANGGLEIIEECIFNSPGDYLEKFMYLVFDYYDSNSKKKKSDLPSLADLEIF